MTLFKFVPRCNSRDKKSSFQSVSFGIYYWQRSRLIPTTNKPPCFFISKTKSAWSNHICNKHHLIISLLNVSKASCFPYYKHLSQLTEKRSQSSFYPFRTYKQFSFWHKSLSSSLDAWNVSTRNKGTLPSKSNMLIISIITKKQIYYNGKAGSVNFLPISVITVDQFSIIERHIKENWK